MSQPKAYHFLVKVSLMTFRALVGAYALNFLIYIPARFIIGESFLPIAFVSTFAQLLILPAFILLPICLFLREWRLSLMLLPAIFFFVFVWGGQFLPNNVVIAEEKQLSLRILSYNMRSNGRNPETYINIIRSSNADIITLQELGISEAEIIQNTLTEIYPYMAMHGMQQTTQGQGVLSRYPILEDEYWQYDYLRSPLGHQRLVVDLGDSRLLTVYNLHPTHPGMNGNIFNPSLRFQELSDILLRSQSEENPTILVGDFNMPNLSPDYQAITEQYTDAFAEVGQGFGWSFPSLPFLRLDYLFYSEGLRAKSAEVLGEHGGSDHFPVSFELIFED